MDGIIGVVGAIGATGANEAIGAITDKAGIVLTGGDGRTTDGKGNAGAANIDYWAILAISYCY